MQRMSFDELSTVFTEVESKLNSRPLTYEYSEVDEEVLTPSHLIYGRRIKTLPDEIVELDDALNHERSSATHGPSIPQHQISSLLEPVAKGVFGEFRKNKLGRPERIVQVGDVVVVYEEDRKQGEWRLGVVESLVTGETG